MPPDALEQELAKLETVLALGIKRVRETASFGEDGKDREDIINLVTLLAVRNPRTRADMRKLYADIFRAMIAMPFEDRTRWDAVVEQLKAAGQWPEGAPVDFEGHKKFVEDNLDKVKPHQNFSLEMELEALERMYCYFDARKWRIGIPGVGIDNSHYEKSIDVAAVIGSQGSKHPTKVLYVRLDRPGRPEEILSFGGRRIGYELHP